MQNQILVSLLKHTLTIVFFISFFLYFIQLFELNNRSYSTNSVSELYMWKPPEKKHEIERRNPKMKTKTKQFQDWYHFVRM